MGRVDTRPAGARRALPSLLEWRPEAKGHQGNGAHGDGGSDCSAVAHGADVRHDRCALESNHQGDEDQIGQLRRGGGTGESTLLEGQMPIPRHPQGANGAMHCRAEGKIGSGSCPAAPLPVNACKSRVAPSFSRYGSGCARGQAPRGTSGPLPRRGVPAGRQCASQGRPAVARGGQVPALPVVAVRAHRPARGPCNQVCIVVPARHDVEELAKAPCDDGGVPPAHYRRLPVL